MAVAAQGLADPRPTGRIDRRHLRKVFDRIGVIQIDSVNVLVRSQELPLFARLGPHPRNLLPDALDDGELFEYWAHMAAIVPSAHHRLFRWRMASAHDWRAVERLGQRAARVHRRGPRAHPRPTARSRPRDLQQRVGPKGPWWDWDDGKIALEYLFHHGRGGRPAAPQRLRPALRPARAGPAGGRAGRPDADRGRGPQGAARCWPARSLGVATLEDLADYHRQRNAPCRPLVAELVEEGGLLPAAVEGWTRPAFVHPRRRRAPTGRRAGHCSARSTRWSGTATAPSGCSASTTASRSTSRPPKRVYGYYVLPFLLDGELVGRIDLKADRAAGVLRVQGAFAELGVTRGAGRAGELAEELRSMAGWLGARRRHDHGSGRAGAELVRAGVARADGWTPSRRRRPKHGRGYAPWVASELGTPPLGHDEPVPEPAADGAVTDGDPEVVEPDPTPPSIEPRRLPRWVVPAVAVFWGGFLAALAIRFFWAKLNGLFVLLAISVFLSLAIEPGVNRLARRGWRRGTATALILFGVIAVFLVFVVAIGTLVGTQIADLLQDSETYITDTVNTINDTFGTNLERPGGDRRVQRPQRRRAGVHPRPAGQRGAACRSPPWADCCSCCR